MPTLTIRLPKDKHQRLKALAESRKISVNKLMEELTTRAIVSHDARLRFAARGAQGDVDQALAVLDGLSRSLRS